MFGFAVWALHDAGRSLLALSLVGFVAIHYALSHDRIAWLLKQ